MVQRLQALEREVAERADKKMLFIEKLKGNDIQHLQAILQDLQRLQAILQNLQEMESAQTASTFSLMKFSEFTLQRVILWTEGIHQLMSSAKAEGSHQGVTRQKMYSQWVNSSVSLFSLNTSACVLLSELADECSGH
ncbi:hypothetical protein Tco_0808689 [Tanacetum coccineum]